MKSLNEAFKELEETKVNFWTNHTQRMEELNAATKSLEQTLANDHGHEDYSETFTRINEDLNALLG